MADNRNHQELTTCCGTFNVSPNGLLVEFPARFFVLKNQDTIQLFDSRKSVTNKATEGFLKERRTISLYTIQVDHEVLTPALRVS